MNLMLRFSHSLTHVFLLLLCLGILAACTASAASLQGTSTLPTTVDTPQATSLPSATTETPQATTMPSATAETVQVTPGTTPSSRTEDDTTQNALRMLEDGKQIFRFDTFGSEAFWGGQLKLHQAIAGEKLGGVGPGLSPKQALALGLKVDLAALPATVVQAVQDQKLNLDDPATTLTLLKVNAVVGVKGNFDANDKLISVGIQCALCHSTTTDDLAGLGLPGIGSRLDGWPNRDLDVGAIIALSPDISPFTKLLQAADPTITDDKVRAVLKSWGPGKFDAELTLDGKAFRPDGKSAATLNPAAFGLPGVNNHTWTGGWGTVTYWNAFVANLEMHGQGTFYDPRLDNAEQYPVAAAAKLGHKKDAEDMITAKLPALHFYQLALPIPQPPAGSFDPAMAQRGQAIFNNKAKCATCHVPPLFTEPGWNLHTAEEIGIDDFQSNRAPDKRYRTVPLRALWSMDKVHKGGFYHDGRFATLLDVVNHYNTFLKLGLTEEEMNDLIQYLMSL